MSTLVGTVERFHCADRWQKTMYGGGIGLFLVLATVSNVATTHSSYTLISAVRFIAAVGICISMLAILLRRGASQRQIVAVICFLFAVSWATFLATIYGVEASLLLSLAVDVPMIVVGIFLVFGSVGLPWPAWLAKAFVFFSLSVVGVTIVVGGMSFEPLPRFNLEVGSELIGREEDYSLGVSFFFGLASIAAVLEATSRLPVLSRVFYGACCLLFLTLGFLGGGRGEIVFALLVLAVIMTFRLRNWVLSVAVVLVVSLIVVGPFFSSWAEQFVVFHRFVSLFEGDMSSRDSLLLNVIHLLQNRPECLLVGCGFSYFQQHFGYDAGLYPHNSFAEAVVTFGLPVALCAAILFVRGALLYFRHVRGMDLFVAFSVYAGLVGLKSQSLSSSWLFLVSLVYFLWLAICSRAQTPSGRNDESVSVNL